MKKQTILAMLVTAVLFASLFTGCGSTENTMSDFSTNEETDAELTTSEEDESSKEDTAEKKQTNSNQTDVDPTDESENKNKKETSDTENAAVPTDAIPSEDESKTDAGRTENSKTENNSGNTNSKPSGGNSSNANTSNSNSNSSSNTQSAGTQPSQPSAPAHEHVWHEHTITTQQWVPNVVTVDDYETQKVVVGSQVQCNCGATFTDTASAASHSAAHVMAGEDDAQWTVDVWEDQQVKVGSHEEDQGHYETVTTVDYYYCDCGATK